MLNEPTIMVIRLREEIDLVSEVIIDVKNVRLIRPLVARMYPPEDGSNFPRLNLLPYLPPYAAADTIDLDWTQVRFIVPPVKELRHKYLEMMGLVPAGLVFPVPPVPPEQTEIRPEVKLEDITENSEAGDIPPTEI